MCEDTRCDVITDDGSSTTAVGSASVLYCNHNMIDIILIHIDVLLLLEAALRPLVILVAVLGVVVLIVA